MRPQNVVLAKIVHFLTPGTPFTFKITQRVLVTLYSKTTSNMKGFNSEGLVYK